MTSQRGSLNAARRRNKDVTLVTSQPTRRRGAIKTRSKRRKPRRCEVRTTRSRFPARLNATTPTSRQIAHEASVASLHKAERKARRNSFYRRGREKNFSRRSKLGQTVKMTGVLSVYRVGKALGSSSASARYVCHRAALNLLSIYGSAHRSHQRHFASAETYIDAMTKPRRDARAA